MSGSIFSTYRGLPRSVYILFFARIVNRAGDFVHVFLTLYLTQVLGLAETAAGTFIMAFGVLRLVGLLTFGAVVDRKGRKWVLVGTQMVTGIVIGVSGFLLEWPYVPYLIVASGFTFGGVRPATHAMVTDLTQGPTRKPAFALMYLGTNLGVAVGPLIAGYLFNNFIQWVFWGDAITTFINVALVVFFVHETAPGRTAEPAAGGETGAAAAGTMPGRTGGSASGGQIGAGRAGPLSGRTGESAGRPEEIVPAASSVGEDTPTQAAIEASSDVDDAALHREAYDPTPSVVAFFRRPVLVFFSLLMLVSTYIYSQHAFALPLYLEQLFSGDGARRFGMIMSFNAIVVLIFTTFLSHITRHQHPLRSLTAAGLLYGAGFGMMGWFTTMPLFFAAAFLWTIGEIFMVTNESVFVASHTPYNHRGRFTSISGFFGWGGAVIGPVISGAVIEWIGTQSLMKAMLVLGVAVALAFQVLRRFDMRRTSAGS